MSYCNPILQGMDFILFWIAQQISTLFAVKKLDDGKKLLEKWPRSHFANPIILSSLLTGLVDGEYYREAIELYDWCNDNLKISTTQSNLRTSVTVSSLIQSCKQTQQFDRAIQFFDEAIASHITLTRNDFTEIIRIYDTSPLWRRKYREMIQSPLYKDRKKWVCRTELMCRRQSLQAKLYLQQLYKGVGDVISCDKEYHGIQRLYNPDTDSFCLNLNWF